MWENDAQSSLSEYACKLSEAIEAHFGIELSEKFVRQFVFEALHASPDLYEEIGQALFLECCELQAQGESITEVTVRKAVHRIRTRLARQASRASHFPISELPRPVPSFLQLSERQFHAALRTLMDLLTAEGALVFHAFFFEKKKPKQIAEMLSLSLSKVYEHLQDAKRVLKQIAENLPQQT